MIYEFRTPLLCTTPIGDGFLWYMKHNSHWDNDEYTVVLKEGGHVKHFLSNQVRIYTNATYEITPENLTSQFPF